MKQFIIVVFLSSLGRFCYGQNPTILGTDNIRIQLAHHDKPFIPIIITPVKVSFPFPDERAFLVPKEVFSKVFRFFCENKYILFECEDWDFGKLTMTTQINRIQLLSYTCTRWRSIRLLRGLRSELTGMRGCDELIERLNEALIHIGDRETLRRYGRRPPGSTVK